MTESSEQPRRGGGWQWVGWGILSLVLYVLSSGPVCAGAMWLYQATGWNECLIVYHLYHPLFVNIGPDNPLGNYIDWWFDLFRVNMPDFH